MATKRKAPKRVRVLRLEIFINSEEEQFESKFTFRGDKNEALGIVSRFLKEHGKEKKSDA